GARGDQRLGDFPPSRSRRRASGRSSAGRAPLAAQRALHLVYTAEEPVRLRSQRPLAVRAGELSVARIDLEDVGHRYAGADNAWALRPMTMTWKDGGAYALLGPSGCGKTTLLNIISGLITPTRGKVLFDGRDITALPPESRNIAQVFQFPVVYDTMTVFDNLAFPLRNRRWDGTRLRQRVEEVAEILELTADLG